MRIHPICGLPSATICNTAVKPETIKLQQSNQEFFYISIGEEPEILIDLSALCKIVSQ